MRCWAWPTTCAVSGGATPVTTAGTASGTRTRAAIDTAPGTGARAAASTGARARTAAAGPGRGQDSVALREVCRDFAAILWEEALRTVERTLIPPGAGTAGGAIYAGVALEALARQLAGQTGLADFVYRTLAAGAREHSGDDRHGSAGGKETSFT